MRRLKRLLDRTGRVEIIGCATDPEQAIAELRSDPPDICFLDIQMPGLNGFEVLDRLPVQPIVIFTTAYDQYALKAFTVNSVDYLLKPIEPEQLDRALAFVACIMEVGQRLDAGAEALYQGFVSSASQPACGTNIAAADRNHRKGSR